MPTLEESFAISSPNGLDPCEPERIKGGSNQTLISDGLD